jgi:hypothetical protein
MKQRYQVSRVHHVSTSKTHICHFDPKLQEPSPLLRIRFAQYSVRHETGDLVAEGTELFELIHLDLARSGALLAAQEQIHRVQLSKQR